MRDPEKVSMFFIEIGAVTLNVLIQGHSILVWARAVKTEHCKGHTIKLVGKVRGLGKGRYNRISQLGTIDI